MVGKSFRRRPGSNIWLFRSIAVKRRVVRLRPFPQVSRSRPRASSARDWRALGPLAGYDAKVYQPLPSPLKHRSGCLHDITAFKVSQSSRAHNTLAPFNSGPGSRPVQSALTTSRNPPLLFAMDVVDLIITPSHPGRYKPEEVVVYGNSTARSSPSPRSSTYPSFHCGSSLEIDGALSLFDVEKPRTSELRLYSGRHGLLHAEMVQLFSASRRPSTLFSRRFSADRAIARRHLPATSRDPGPR